MNLNLSLKVLNKFVEENVNALTHLLYRSLAVAYSSVCMYIFIADAPWTVLLANIEPESTGVTVGGLIPARSYQFRLCAVNDVGRGQFSKETDRWVLH